ncbi:MAG: archease [Gemmatimonadetes bacterium]|nr:archease [Gemmatimonadota bacterium]
MRHDSNAVPPGVRWLDHTADVGLELRARDLPELFRRAAAGMLLLLYGSVREVEQAGAAERREIVLEAEDVASLLALWLRELLYLHDVHGLACQEAEFPVLHERGLSARVHCTRPPGAPLRELKGVTYHGLRAERRGGEWRARVIFDV